MHASLDLVGFSFPCSDRDFVDEQSQDTDRVFSSAKDISLRFLLSFCRLAMFPVFKILPRRERRVALEFGIFTVGTPTG